MSQEQPYAPVSADEQLQVRVAWLYYMEGRTQGEIAELVRTNRPRINRMISEARRSGLVTVKLNSRLTSCIELEDELKSRFGLNHAVIVPTPVDPGMVPEILGVAAADYLTHLITTDVPNGIGIGWGQTLREMVRQMPLLRKPEICVSSVMGGLTRGIEINTFDIASDLARQLGAECAYLAAPIYAGSPESRDAIINQDVFRDAFERIARNDLILLTIGDLSERSLLMRYGLPREMSIDELVSAGAVGDVLGQFIDCEGQPIAHALNQRAIALPLKKLTSIPNVVFLSGGSNKAQVIAAVLRSGLGNTFICDEDAARRALQIAGKDAR